MDLVATAQAVETRRDEQHMHLAELSASTLRYMIEYGVALESRLRHHRVELGYQADDEFDLLEAMRLSSRLKRVETNISRAGRVNAGLRAELLSRELRGG
ncbi:MAG: hypothetical protein JXB46_03405 [Candidatus Eisenbacteria bacterium]|nr:hypothetical protein [Candidatus Eisenbacteria bacterium]